MSGGFPIDLILFAMVAAFLVLRLRSVLGRRTGFERPRREGPGAYDPAQRPAELGGELPAPAAAADSTRRIVPDPRSPVGAALVRIRGVDSSFDPEGFLHGAEGAFRMVVDAFAKGDRQTLRMLLSDETYAGFEGEITRREQAGETQRSEVRAMQETRIEAADLRGTVADVTVRFVSDQVNLTTGRDGAVVAGAEAVTELTDIWTFQRDLRSEDPTWKLVATRSG
ncbi:Tim44/TimA family putative adaptor protein [Leptolyngbya sp. 15MV]|nr:Tim44/TimA family putative adaptor protein [Leptolyngbya sp. 15MV]